MSATLYLFYNTNDYLFTNLSFARAHSRSEELERAQFFSHLITNFLPFLITRPL